MDTRNAANNTDSQLFYSWSTDGGVTWAPNVAVSNPLILSNGYPVQNKMGDYITIVSGQHWRRTWRILVHVQLQSNQRTA